MKNLLFFSLSILFISFGTNAQQVISSGGEYFENSTVSISWTLGEPVTETISNGTNILTQGFQQTKLSASEIFTLNSEEYNISLFPNPTLNIVNLKISVFNNLTYNISEVNGRLLKERKIISENTEISFAKLPAAVYLLKVFNNKKIIKVFQIVKQ